MAEQEPSLGVGEFAQLTGLLLGALIFFILIAVDIRVAVRKGNFWVPGRALALSALTIQFMNFIEDRSALLNQALLDQSFNSNCTYVDQHLLGHYRNCTESTDVQNSNCTLVAKVQFTNNTQVQSTLFDQNSKPLMVVKSNVLDEGDEVHTDILFMVHCSRVMLCVLIAFFLPGMARPGYEQKWITITALGFTLFLHIFSELLSVHRKSGISPIDLVYSFSFYFSIVYHRNGNVWIIVYGAIISLSLVWLLQLLVCAAIANKGIRNITLQKIPLMLPNPSENSLQAVEDQVLKSWIVFRACYPESIIASSALASSAGLAVTVCLVLSIVGWIIQGPFTITYSGPGFWLRFIITIVEILFSLIGGAISSWRWLKSVVYYERWRKKEEKWRNYFLVEYYWTKHILDVQEYYWTKHILDVQKTEEFPMLKRLHKIIGNEGKSYWLLQCVLSWLQPVFSWLLQYVQVWLLQCVFWLQWLVVFVSKGYWFLSKLAFTNKLLQKIATMLLSKHLENVEKEFEKYKALLSDVYIFRETPQSVFLTNRKSIKQAKGVMENGNKDGKECHALISFLQKHGKPETLVDISGLHPGTANDPDSTLDMKTLKRSLIYFSKRSRKLTAVSLVNIISRLGGDSCGRDYFKVYQQAWELMYLVEESDPETNSLLSKAADREFVTLRMHSAQNGKTSPAPKTIREAGEAIKGLARERANAFKKEGGEAIKGPTEAKEAISRLDEDTSFDEDTSLDWENIAGITVYKICESMASSSGDLTELMEELESILAHIIGACIEKVGVALVENSRKWAQEMQEKKLVEAVYIAGKSTVVIEKLGWGPNLRIAPITGNQDAVRTCSTPPKIEELESAVSVGLESAVSVGVIASSTDLSF